MTKKISEPPPVVYQDRVDFELSKEFFIAIQHAGLKRKRLGREEFMSALLMMVGAFAVQIYEGSPLDLSVDLPDGYKIICLLQSPDESKPS